MHKSRIVGGVAATLGVGIVVLGGLWVSSADYRQARFAYLLSNPGEIVTVSPALLVCLFLAVVLVAGSLLKLVPRDRVGE